MKKINNLNINYSFKKTSFSDEYVLFLHGYAGSIDSFLFFQNNIKDKNTLNIDLPGFGLSERPPDSFTIYDYAEAVQKLLKELSIKKVSIVSHSFGSRIAIILSSLKPKLVSKMVIIDGAGLKPRFNLFTYLKIKKYKLLKKLVNKKVLKDSVLNKYGSADLKLNKIPQKVFVSVVNTHLNYLLKLVSCPTLLLWGKRDKSTPLYMAKIMNKRIKDSALIVFKKAGHFSYVERPQKALIIIKNFLGCE